MQPPDALIKQRHHVAALLGDGRQSGTSGWPSILNASPEARPAAAWRCCRPATRSASISTRARADILISKEEIAKRRATLKEGGYRVPDTRRRGRRSQRAMVDQLSEGMVLKGAVKFQDVAHKFTPRDSH